MTFYFAVIGLSGCVDSVLSFEEVGLAPEGAIPIPDYTGIPSCPGDYAQLKLADGVLSWHDPRTTDQKASEARAKRDVLLSQTDWIVTRSMERGEAVPSTWVTFREALRDIPSQAGFPSTIVWPVQPD